MPYFTEAERIAARREIEHPVGAFDQITPDGEHPLAAIAKGQAPPYGRLSSDDERQRVILDVLNIAADKATNATGAANMPQTWKYEPPSAAGKFNLGKGDQEQSDQPFDADQLMEFVTKCLNALAPDEQGRFLGQLAALTTETSSYNGGDSRRRRRAAAMDARYRDTGSFDRRFPSAAHIRTSGL